MAGREKKTKNMTRDQKMGKVQTLCSPKTVETGQGQDSDSVGFQLCDLG